MNYLFIPDLAAMALLLAILYFLRKRHPREAVNFWLVGLLFIFLEAVVYAAYPPAGPWRLAAHVIALNSFFIAGAIFLWAAGRDLFPRKPALIYVVINSLPVFAFLTLYGLGHHNAYIDHAIAASGLIIGVVSAFLLARTAKLGHGWWLVLVQLCTWTPIWLFVSAGLFRAATYFVLSVLYLATAIVFQLNLPRKSLGKVAIVIGFVIWSLVFLSHAWVSNHAGYDAISDQIWNLQKFLVTIGMLLVLLEQQVASNEWYALHDHLTGLPNRRHFERSLAAAIQQSQRNNTRTALLMLDLNGFKSINDSLGHEIGDQILQRIAVNLRSVIRTPDTLARLGGDEFIIIATDIPIDQPAQLIVDASIARISQALSKPVTIAGTVLTVSGSVGVAIYPDDTTDEVLLRRLADQRMYQQKHRTLNGYPVPEFAGHLTA
jgi:diguanylate cyclase (GGDEF)-like protein